MEYVLYGKDISEFIENDMGAASDSEAEDEASKVVLPERFLGKGNGKSQQSAIKLVELGPRVTLELYKVERGLCEGDVLYHKFESKSAEEAADLKKKKDAARLLKIQRKAEQAANVKRKRAEAEEKRIEKMEKKRQRLETSGKFSEVSEDDNEKIDREKDDYSADGSEDGYDDEESYDEYDGDDGEEDERMDGYDD